MKIKNEISYLVTGVGRCGTGSYASLFNQNGLPCGHEKVFNLSGYNNKHNLVADSSWLAVPFLGTSHIPKETKLIHIVRNPIDMINSFYQINWFSNKDGYVKFALKNSSWKFDKDEHDVVNLTRHYIHWNTKIEGYEDAYPYKRYRLEDGMEPICADMGFTYENEIVKNKKPCHRVIRREEIINILKDNTELYEELNLLSHKYNYELL